MASSSEMSFALLTNWSNAAYAVRLKFSDEMGVISLTMHGQVSGISAVIVYRLEIVAWR